jgi:hypothetical protein
MLSSSKSVLRESPSGDPSSALVKLVRMPKPTLTDESSPVLIVAPACAGSDDISSALHTAPEIRRGIAFKEPVFEALERKGLFWTFVVFMPGIWLTPVGFNKCFFASHFSSDCICIFVESFLVDRFP